MRARDQLVTSVRTEAHPTAMIDRPGWVLRWFFNRFFRWIDFPSGGAQKVREAAERGTVVYVCRTLSYIDYLYFTFAFLHHGLPLARFANGVKTLLMQPLSRLLFRRRRNESDLAAMSEASRSGEAVLLFLKRPRTLLSSDPAGFREKYVEELVRIQRERDERGRPIIFVPLTVLWGSPALRAAKARRGIIDIVFGEREAPGRLRALFTFFTHYKESQVLVGPPLDLHEFLAAETGESSDEVLARKLRWQLAGRIESEIRVVLGPPRKGARRISREVLRGRKLVAEAQTIAKNEQIAPHALERRARSCLKEIAADPKPWAFDFARPILNWVWRKIFDGFEIDHAGLERLKEAARKGPLILIPSHKSHIDYLVLTYVFYENDLVPPHIAAGANLSFWPLGFLFRRGGAFFLRRTFKGDRLYGAVFRAYVRKLLREGFSIEFFIEGGRSRTGKLLAPKLGLLGMIVDAALDDPHALKAQIVPLSIGYEKVIEEKSYARELAGGEKKKEDVRGLLKATRVLGSNFGQLNIQFDEPFELGEALRELGAVVAWDADGDVVPAAPEAVRLATQRLAHRVVYGINRVTAVTPTALVASALLASGKRGIVRRRLLAEARFLMARAIKSGGRLAETLSADGALNLEALDRVLEILARDGYIQIRAGGASGAVPLDGSRPLDEIYTIVEERRPRLVFYRNNAIHLYVADALIALAFSASLGSEKIVPRTLLRERTLRLSRLLKLEFSYRVGEGFESIFERTLAELISSGIFAVRSDTIALASRKDELDAADCVQVLAGQVRDFVESYWVAARAVQNLSAPMAEKDVVRRIHELGEKLFFTGEITRREACVRANYQNAVSYFVERGLLYEQDKKLRVREPAAVRHLSSEIAELLT